MIPGGLVDVFGAVFVGIVSIAALSVPFCTFLLFLKPRRRPHKWFSTVVSLPSDSLRTGLIVFAAYGGGIIINSAADFATDSANPSVGYWIAPNFLDQCRLHSEFVHRARALFKGEPTQEGDRSQYLTSVGRELFGNSEAMARYRGKALDHRADLKEKFGGSVVSEKDLRAINGFVEATRTCPYSAFPEQATHCEGYSVEKQQAEAEKARVVDLCKGLSNGLFYWSKNATMLESTYASELSQRQSVLDWSRSCAAVCGVSLWLALLVIIAGLSVRFVLGLISPSAARSVSDFLRSVGPREPGRYGLAILSLYVAMSVFAFAYCTASRELNQRAIGYDITAERRKFAERTDAATRAVSPKPDEIDWMLRSPEYAAICVQQFDRARRIVEQAIQDGKVPATIGVVVDLDDTITQSVEYNADIRDRGVAFSEAEWQRFAAKRDFAAVPGALDFVARCIELRVPVFVVSKRTASHRGEVREWLLGKLSDRLSFPSIPKVFDEVVEFFLCDEGADPNMHKKSAVARILREPVQGGGQRSIVAYVGDDIRDFEYSFACARLESMRLASDGDPVLRDALTGDPELKTRMLKRWVVLPNPVYGSWTKPAGGVSAK